MAKVSARRRHIGINIGSAMVIGIGFFWFTYYTPDMIKIAKSFTQDKTLEIRTNKLRLNNNDWIALVTKNKSEEEGYKDIDEIINTSTHEEAWLCIPELKEWYEIGINRNTITDEWGNFRNSSAIDINYVDRVLERKNKQTSVPIKEVYFIHNHSIKKKIVSDNIKNVKKKIMFRKKILREIKVNVLQIK